MRKTAVIVLVLAAGLILAGTVGRWWWRQEAVQATPSAETVAVTAPVRMEMVRLEMPLKSPARERTVLRAVNGSLPPEAQGVLSGQCIEGHRRVSHRLYIEFDTRQTTQSEARLVFTARIPNGQARIAIAEYAAGPAQPTGQTAGWRAVKGNGETVMVELPVTVQAGAITGLHLYLVGVDDQPCDPAKEAFIGKPEMVTVRSSKRQN